MSTSNSKLILNTVKTVVLDDAFMIASVSAKRARDVCVILNEWMKIPESAIPLNYFAEQFVSLLKSCIPTGTGTAKREREKMWINFHRTRLSDTFIKLWVDFVSNAIQVEPSSLLFQHITDVVFQAIITRELDIPEKNATTSAEITYEEANALRYVAGFVCSKVQKKITASKHSHRDRMLLCLMDLCDDSEEEGAATWTSEWVNAIDRGGLCHVSDGTYMVFQEMEVVLRSTYNKDKAKILENGNRGKLVQTIIKNEDVQFQWCMVTTEVEDEEARSLLNMIVNLYVTIRGFSFAKSIMEQYKVSNKKNLQKSKALRKKLET